jgi:uncharacterized membrane protein
MFMEKKISFKKTYKEYLDGKIKLKTYQKVGILFLIVVIAGFIGWVYEFLFSFITEGKWYMEGGNLLPWINIYAFGAIAVIPLTYRFRKYPWAVLLISFLVTGLVELIGGWLVYTIGNGTRYWDYNNQPWNFGNIGGFVCLLSVSVFTVLSGALMYAVLPFCIFLSRRMSKKAFMTLAITLFTLIMLDELTNLTLKNLNLPTAMDFYRSLGWEYL